MDKPIIKILAKALASVRCFSLKGIGVSKLYWKRVNNFNLASIVSAIGLCRVKDDIGFSPALPRYLLMAIRREIRLIRSTDFQDAHARSIRDSSTLILN